MARREKPKKHDPENSNEDIDRLEQLIETTIRQALSEEERKSLLQTLQKIRLLREFRDIISDLQPGNGRKMPPLKPTPKPFEDDDDSKEK